METATPPKKETTTIVTDKQKLKDFCASLGQITGPELKDADARELLENALFFLSHVREHLSDEIKLLK